MTHITDVELKSLPRRIDRRTAAALISRHLFPISPRTLERWPVAWHHINGRALVDTAELVAEAERRLAEAPAIRGGQ